MSSIKQCKIILAQRGFPEHATYTFRPTTLQEFKDRVRATDPDMILKAIHEIARLARTHDTSFISQLFQGLTPTPSLPHHHAAILFFNNFKACPENFNIWIL